MPFSNLFGHISNKKHLIHLLDNNKFPQVFLFSGPSGVGKKSFALACAKTLFGKDHFYKIDKKIHPDVHFFLPQGKKEQHSIESIREVIEKAYRAPFEAPFSFFIIDKVEKMLPTSSNALLKILEEPPKHVYIMLIAEEGDKLLPTILSRTQKMSFTSLSDEEIFDFLQFKGIDEPKAKEIAPLSLGSIGKALSLLESKDSDLSQTITKLLVLDAQLDYIEILEVCISLQKLIDDEETDENTVLEAILYWFRDIELLKSGADHEFLYHKSFYKELQKSSLLYSLSLKETIEILTDTQLAIEHNIKASHAIENFIIRAQKSHLLRSGF